MHNISLGFGLGPARVNALDRINLTLESGLFTVISGPSGSGKTSLISVLGALIEPDAGALMVGGRDITKLSLKQRAEFRRQKIGFVFQSFRLMPALSAEENVMLSLELRRIADGGRLAKSALDVVGLAEKAHLRPDQMSHGEKQRVAIARAIAHKPSIVLADEPTASLDAANGAQIVRLLTDVAQDERIVAMVTHDQRVLPLAQRIIRLEDGRLLGDQQCVV
jgi:putative ABC transport system ATP-binding protein